jgi:hypothetical protein
MRGVVAAAVTQVDPTQKRDDQLGPITVSQDYDLLVVWASAAHPHIQQALAARVIDLIAQPAVLRDTDNARRSRIASPGREHRRRVRAASPFWKNVGLRGGPAPVRSYLPDLLERVWDGRINPGKVFDLTPPLEQVAEAYAAMDERRATKVLLHPWPHRDHTDPSPGGQVGVVAAPARCRCAMPDLRWGPPLLTPKRRGPTVASQFGYWTSTVSW